MKCSSLIVVLTLALSASHPPILFATEAPLRTVVPADDPTRAVVRILRDQPSPHPVPRYITGKFAEHLWWNIYNGMDAQVLKNPTFADYPFRAGPMSPDGRALFHWEPDRINDELRRQATRYGWPEEALADLVQSREDSLACFWSRLGPRAAVGVSPDTGPGGGRAQRISVQAARQGIQQWTWLPLHRVRQFDVEVCARAPEIKELTIGIARGQAAVEQKLTGLGPDWKTLRGTLTVPEDWPADESYPIRLTAPKPGQWVVRHVLVRPADHIHGADPDVVRLLRESHLPILRWPGGNFVSAYHWEDGLGPLERRPARPNYAWGGVEPNLFGTHEFIAFCRAVGCEPMICINAGDGTPAEAARWVEYCNGGVDTPMGARRAANGHPAPFNVRHWEVGNELWGKWQCHWTTAAGYVDRYRQFAAAMRRADPAIRLYACGAPVLWGKEWNDTLIRGLGSELSALTDHPLIGGTVPADTDPLDVFRDFMAVPEVLESKWAALRDRMRRAGIAQPHLAVTELQLFARIGRPRNSNAPRRLTRETLPDQDSITEALYDVLVYHAALRLAPLVGMVTHSATVNHGGGLRKERERVYPNPCHYAQSLFAVFAEATPLPVEIHTAVAEAPRVLPDLRRAASQADYGLIDAFAARTGQGAVLVSLVNRGTSGSTRVSIELPGLQAGRQVEVALLKADGPAAGNSLERPKAVVPQEFALKSGAGRVELELPCFSLARLRMR